MNRSGIRERAFGFHFGGGFAGSSAAYGKVENLGVPEGIGNAWHHNHFCNPAWLFQHFQTGLKRVVLPPFILSSNKV